jgi:alkyl hydroperoxide reductase subunit AhpC
LAEFKKQYHLIQKYKTDIFAISVDTPKQSQAVIREMDLPFQLLCDADKKVITQYHLLNTHEHGGIAYPAIFVIRPSGRIQYRSLDGTAQRVELSDILSFLEKLGQDDGFISNKAPKKKIIIPFPNHAWQISKNMLFRGNFADWKHYVLFPFSMVKFAWKKGFGSANK